MSDKKLQATHYSEKSCGLGRARFYHVSGGDIARLDVKNDKWVMAGDWVHLSSLIPIVNH
jgi:hypothetical protein